MLLPEAIVRALRAERKGELASLVERKRELASLVERKSALPERSRFLQVPDQLWKLKFDICLEFGVFNFEFQPVCGLWSVVCCLWSVVSGLWSAVCGLLPFNSPHSNLSVSSQEYHERESLTR